ncbi:MAG: hypothetical protein NT069_34465 [Planctomycetota bacterium]|nr:hypothetical protein [Planctomycetota bacterium]
MVRQLSLPNFRGFDLIDRTFDRRVTFIGGVNGTGTSEMNREAT